MGVEFGYSVHRLDGVTMFIVSAMRIIRVSVIIGVGSMFVMRVAVCVTVTMCVFGVMMSVLHRMDD